MTTPVNRTSFWIVCFSYLVLKTGLVLAQVNDATVSNSLQVGFGQVEITPVRPTPMAGYYGNRLSTATHDPLWSKATVMDDGQTSVAIIALDLVATTKWLVDETRSLIADQSKLSPECILISATHSHTGPVLFDPNSSRYNRFGNEATETKQFMLDLPSKIAASVTKAIAAKQPLTVRHAIGEEPQLAFNRRFSICHNHNPRISQWLGRLCADSSGLRTR